MNNILKGILKYRKTYRNSMVSEFERVRDHPEVTRLNITNSNFFSMNDASKFLLTA